MPIDSINYGRELRNIFAEIKSLRAEMANMQSALLSVQNEIAEIKSQLQNSAEITNKNLSALEELLRLIAANQMLDEVEKNLPTKNNSLPSVSSKKQIQNSTSTKNNSSEQKNSAQSKSPLKAGWLEGVFQHGQECIALGGIDNRKIAFKNFLEAAEHGHIGAMKWLADCYRYGWGTTKDSNKDKYWRDKWERSR